VEKDSLEKEMSQQYVYENVGFCNKEEEKIQPHAPCCRWPTRRADECNHFQMVTFGRPMERLAEGLQMSLFDEKQAAGLSPDQGFVVTKDQPKVYHGPVPPKVLVDKIAQKMQNASPREHTLIPGTASPTYSMAVPGYEPLARILQEAYMQSAAGKGLERHADHKDFLSQPILRIGRKYGFGFNIGQAAKKMEEAQGMIERDEVAKARHEFLGAIVYLASAILLLEESSG
jgi:hypothetical protein